jgi:hypothetical protein
MARVLLGDKEIWVAEEVEEVMTRIVNSKDGIRRGGGSILSPPGWVILTASDSGELIYAQAARIGYICED